MGRMSKQQWAMLRRACKSEYFIVARGPVQLLRLASLQARGLLKAHKEASWLYEPTELGYEVLKACEGYVRKG